MVDMKLEDCNIIKRKKIAILLKYQFPMLSEQLPFTNSGRLAGWGRQVELGRLSLLPYPWAQPLMPSADEKSLLRRRNSALCVSSVAVAYSFAVSISHDAIVQLGDKLVTGCEKVLPVCACVLSQPQGFYIM